MQHWPHDYAARRDTSSEGNEITWINMKLVEISERVSSQALLSLSLSMYIYIYINNIAMASMGKFEFFDRAPAPLQVEQLASSPGTEKSRCLQDFCSQNRHLHISFTGVQRPLRLSLCLYVSVPICHPNLPDVPEHPRTTSKKQQVNTS